MNTVEAWSKVRTVAECLAAFDAGGVPSARYNDPADALTDEQLLARGTFVKVRDAVGEFTGVNPPYRLSGSKADLRSPVPQAGEHSEAVLQGVLGLNADELQFAREKGAFGT